MGLYFFRLEVLHRPPDFIFYRGMQDDRREVRDVFRGLCRHTLKFCFVRVRSRRYHERGGTVRAATIVSQRSGFSRGTGWEAAPSAVL